MKVIFMSTDSEGKECINAYDFDLTAGTLFDQDSGVSISRLSAECGTLVIAKNNHS